MTLATGRLDEPTIRGAGLATEVHAPRPLLVPGRLSRATEVVGDSLGAVAIVLCFPFVILAIGIPIALCVRLLSWVGERLL